MKTTFRTSSIMTALVVTLVATIGVSALADNREMYPDENSERMDIGTHAFLIEKLETVLKATPEGDSTRVPAMLRLADLYSERGRLTMLKEIEAGCAQNKAQPICGSSEGDRKGAIRHYEGALKESNGSMQSRILFQLAHLYEVDGRDSLAADLYKQIIKAGQPQFSKVVVGQSLAGLGEIAFRSKNFKEARAKYEEALQNTATPRQGWIVYRLAWCDLNLNQTERGKQRLLTILKTPALTRLESTEGVKTDSSFQEDVARDLTIFYAKTGYDKGDVEELWNLSPVDARKSILMDLAEESERVGEKRASISVWAVLAAKTKDTTSTGYERLEAQTRVTSLHYSLGDKKRAESEFAATMAMWKTTKCTPTAECDLLQKRLRKLVIDWNKNETTEPTASLFSVYQSYARQFALDAEMAFWGANVGRALKKNRDAVHLYRQAADASLAAIKAKSEDKNMPTVFEGSLLAEIEMAELTQDTKLREQAYNHYLELNPNGQKALEVRYQLAHMAYKRGDVKASAPAFFVLAKDARECREHVAASKQICRAAADLSLDALVILKDDSTLEQWATQLAATYPDASAEYTKIARRARLNMAAKAANGSSKSEMNDNLAKLREANLAGASREDTLLTYRNRFVLAEKTKNLDEADAAATAILAYKGSSASDREDALAKKLWVAETKKDFVTAYATAKQMKMSGTRADERELRLSYLAELAGKDAKPHLRAYIAQNHNQTRDKKGELAARVRLMKLSGYSAREFDAQFQALSKSPEIFASVAIEVYARQPSKSLRTRILAVRGVAKTADGAHIARSSELKTLETWMNSLGRTSLPQNASDKVLAHALQTRVQDLARADRFANSMIATKDGWLQAVALNSVAKENRRLHDEILSLPAPKGLKGQEKKRYSLLIERQVQPFARKAGAVEHKLASFWSASESYSRSVEASAGPKRQMLAREARILAMGAPASVAKRLTKAAESNEATYADSAVNKMGARP